MPKMATMALHPQCPVEQIMDINDHKEVATRALYQHPSKQTIAVKRLEGSMNPVKLFSECQHCNVIICVSSFGCRPFNARILVSPFQRHPFTV